MARALVTGANGFVGGHLVAHLTEAGDEVITTDRTHGGPDLLDPDGWRALLADVRPEVVYHLAGDADVGGSWHRPLATFRSNAEGTLNVLVAAREAGVARVLHVGSADIYGRVAEADLPITEDHPVDPVSPYAASKAAAELLAHQAVRGYGLDVVCVRAFNHLGPGQSERFVAPAIALRIARNELTGGEEVPVGNLSPRRDVTDVRDVVRAYRLLMERGRTGVAYNVCSGHALAVAEIAERLLGLARHPMRLVADPDLARPVDTPVLVGSAERLAADTGWEPRIPIETTLEDLMADCRERATAVPSEGPAA